jgi:hypothetical protein
LNSGNDRTGRAQDVAEAYGTESLAGSASGSLTGTALDDKLCPTLAGSHDVGRAHRLVGGNQDEGFDARVERGPGQGQGAEDVVARPFQDVRLDHRHVLVRGGVVDGGDPVLGQETRHQAGVTDRAETGHQFAAEDRLQQAVDLVQRVLARVEQDQAAGLQRRSADTAPNRSNRRRR